MAIRESDLREWLSRGHEVSGIEFKGPGDRRDKAYLAKVVRAVLAMANRRDGGYVVLGIDDTAPAVVEGLSAKELRSWCFDEAVGAINAYAEPFLTLDVQPLRIDGKDVVVLSVHEFESVPILCKKDYQKTLREGACYVRRRAPVESSEVPNYAEMRELLDLAIEKGVVAFLARSRRVREALDGAGSSDRERFAEQLKDFE